MNETTNHKQIAAAQVQAPTQKITVTSNAKAYLDTEEANVDFAKFIAENYGKSNSAVIKAWAEKMAEKGITVDDILPTTIEQTFFKVWTSDRGIKTLSALKGRSEKILVAPEGFISGLMLEKDNDGRYVFAPGSNFSQLLTAKIFEFDFMTDCGMDLIGFNDGKYLLPSGRDMLRSAFDNDYNQDVLLHEKPVAGSLFGRKVCAGYASAATSTASDKKDEGNE